MKPSNFAGFTLYRIYYGDVIVYLGRTMQPLQNRIRGHLFKKPMHRVLHIEQISKIEYATFQSEADMFLYEIYFINLYKPCLNRDDLAYDNLSVELPNVEWNLFSTPLWEKWKAEINARDEDDLLKKQHKLSMFEKDREMRKKRRNGEITDKEYWLFWETNIRNL
jgi:hypothetical protein